MSTYQNYLHPYSQALNNPLEPYRQNTQPYPPQIWSTDPYDTQGASSSNAYHAPSQMRWVDEPHQAHHDDTIYPSAPIASSSAPVRAPIPSPTPTPSPAPVLPTVAMPPPVPRPASSMKKEKPDIVTRSNVEVDELRAEVIRLRQTVGRLEALLSANGISIPSEQIKAPDTSIFTTRLGVANTDEEEKLVSMFDGGDYGYQADDQGQGSSGGAGGSGKALPKKVKAEGKGKKRKRAVVAAAGSDIEEIPAPKPKSVTAADVPRNALTGKPIEKIVRRVGLSKEVRAQIHRELGIDEGMNLPVRRTGQTDADATLPDWSAGANNEWNSAWIDRVSTATLTSLLANPKPKIEESEINIESITAAARTAFINYCKRWVTENDPDARAKREAHTKSRRRWGRKDLKQKRRLKAAADLPSLLLPEGALLIDYMSSEYSSPGPDSATSDDDGEGGDVKARIRRSERRREGRKRKWDEVRAEYSAAGTGDGAGGEPEVFNGATGRAWNKGHAQGMGKTKVLEVRPPSWRSAEYNNLYAILEAHASTLTQVRTVITPSGPSAPPPSFAGGESGNLLQDYNTLILANPEPPRNAHVAPSHVRFIMPDALRRAGSGKAKVAKRGGRAKKEE